MCCNCTHRYTHRYISHLTCRPHLNISLLTYLLLGRTGDAESGQNNRISASQLWGAVSGARSAPDWPRFDSCEGVHRATRGQEGSYRAEEVRDLSYVLVLYYIMEVFFKETWSCSFLLHTHALSMSSCSSLFLYSFAASLFLPLFTFPFFSSSFFSLPFSEHSEKQGCSRWMLRSLLRSPGIASCHVDLHSSTVEHIVIL